MKNIYLQAIGLWVVFAIITVFFGAFREIIFIPATGLEGNLARAILLPLAFFYIFSLTFLLFKKTSVPFSLSDSMKIGLLWLILTLIFEFSFGGLIMGHSFEKLLADYNLLEGKTWSLFLVCMLIAPYIVVKFFIKNKG